MPQINEWTMVIAIRVVAAEIRAQREALKSDDTIAEEYQQLEDLMEAAEDLESAYEASAKTMLNLPPYDELVNGQ